MVSSQCARVVVGTNLDVQTMVWTRGKVFPISMLSSRMRCPACGTREVVITVSLPGSVLAAAAKAASSQ